MAITNYTELQSAVADWLNRHDLDDVIPTFISLAEARINRELRVRQMVKRATAVLEDTYITLPTDWLEAKNIQGASPPAPVPLTYLTLEQADAYRRAIGNRSGTPQHFTIVGAQLELLPTPAVGTEIELTYYAAVPTLSPTAPSNWLLSTWPDVYLYGALATSAPYLKDDERLMIWGGIYDGLVDEIRQADERAQYSGSVLKPRVRPYG